MIMEYVDSKTDAFVVAGGDGTLFEVRSCVVCKIICLHCIDIILYIKFR